MAGSRGALQNAVTFLRFWVKGKDFRAFQPNQRFITRSSVENRGIQPEFRSFE